MNPVRLAVWILVMLVLQVSLFGRFSFEGARPDVMVLVVVAAAFVMGPERGAVVGFAAGLAFDVVLTTPFGLSALVYTLVGWAAGSIGMSLVRTSWWIAPLLFGAASGAAMVLYAVVGEIFGQATLRGPDLTAIVVVVAGLNAVLAPLALRCARWVRTDEHDRRHPFALR